MAEPRSEWLCEVAGLLAQLAKAQAKSERAAERRYVAGVTTRARGASMNAAWMRAAEHRDCLERQLEELGVVIPYARPKPPPPPDPRQTDMFK